MHYRYAAARVMRLDGRPMIALETDSEGRWFAIDPTRLELVSDHQLALRTLGAIGGADRAPLLPLPGEGMHVNVTGEREIGAELTIDWRGVIWRGRLLLLDAVHTP